MFKTGEKIVCVDNSLTAYLELDSIYVVESSDKTGTFLVDGFWYLNDRFITLKEHRRNKINKIVSCSE